MMDVLASEEPENLLFQCLSQGMLHEKFSLNRTYFSCLGGGDNTVEGSLEGGAGEISEHGDGGEVPGKCQRDIGEGEAGPLKGKVHRGKF